MILIGDCGTGKTHLLTGLCIAACRQKRRVRFATAAALVNELVEAKQQLQLRRVLARWDRYDLIAIDEVGYVPMADLGAEFLFQVIAERAEKAAVIVTTNLPFSEWTQVIPNAAAVQGATGSHYRSAHIIETGTDSLSLPTNGGGRKEEEGFVITGPGKGLNAAPSPAPLPGCEPGSLTYDTKGWAKVNCHGWAKTSCQTQRSFRKRARRSPGVSVTDARAESDVFFLEP